MGVDRGPVDLDEILGFRESGPPEPPAEDPIERRSRLVLVRTPSPEETRPRRRVSDPPNLRPALLGLPLLWVVLLFVLLAVIIGSALLAL